MAPLRGRQRVAFDALIFSDGTTPNKPLLNLLACSYSGEHSELPGPIRELVLTDAAEFAEARTPRRAAQFQKGSVSHHWHSPLLLGRSMYDNAVYLALSETAYRTCRPSAASPKEPDLSPRLAHTVTRCSMKSRTYRCGHRAASGLV